MRDIMGLMRDTYRYMSVLRDSLRDAERDLEGASLVDLCVHHHQCRRGYDNLKKALTDIYKLVDKQSKVTIPEAMDEAGADKIRVPEVETSFYPLVKYSALDARQGESVPVSARQQRRGSYHGDGKCLLPLGVPA